MDILEAKDLIWEHYKDDDSFDYPIDYSGAIIDIRDDGHVDVVYRWAPNSYCHFHRHTADTSSLILAGEMHITDYEDGKPVGTRIRKAGDYSHKPAGDVHMERGGPEGAIVFFSIYAPDGILTEGLTKDGQVIAVVTTDSLRARWEEQNRKKAA